MQLGALAAAIGARLLGDANLEVVRVCAIENARAGDLAFVDHAHARRAAFHTTATALIVDETFAANHAHELDCAVLCGDDTSLLLLRALQTLHPTETPPPRRHPSATIAASTSIAADVSVGPGAVVEDDVVIGAGTILGPHVVLRRGVHIGARVRIGAGCVLGDEGFVFASDGTPVPHVGSVAVDDDVWLGANVCIDRGLLRDTRIGARCRIDNLVHIAHDVVIGCDVVIAALVGIAGHATIGAGASLAGQAGIGPHVRLAARARVGGQAGVTTDVVDEGAAVSGTPAFPHRDWLKATARSRRIP
jgi:UDP-3-O-[3-hydroxymyristoyl] glucosamine N-acyltransferase